MRRRRFARDRGIALIIALLMLALSAAVATEFLYNTRVDLQAANNARMRQQARFAAKAGVEAGTTFLRIDRFNDWAAVIEQIGVPGFGVGGFVKMMGGAPDEKEMRDQRRKEAIAAGDKPPPSGTAANPYDQPNGYMSFISSTTGFNFFDDDNVDVEIRFIDEAGKFNVNALVYWMPAGGGKPAFNVRLYRQIAQLLMDQTVPQGDTDNSATAGLRRKFRAKGSDRFRHDEAGSRGEDAMDGAATADDVGKFMCALLDWLDPDNDTAGSSSGSYSCDGGAEKDYYTQLDQPYEPRNGPLESIGELRLIRGMTPAMYRKVAPYLTVYTRNDYTVPPQAQNNCASTLWAPENVPNNSPALPCFSPDVNLHSAADPVIEAFFVGGCKSQNPQFGDCNEDFQRMNAPDVRDNLLNAINCFRGPGLQSDRIVNTQSKMVKAAVGEKGSKVNLSGGLDNNASDSIFDCPKGAMGAATAPSGGNPAGSTQNSKYLFMQDTLKTVLNSASLPYTGDELIQITNRFTLGLSLQPPPSPQKFDTITSRWITIEAIGLVGVASDMEPVESRVSATIFLVPVVNPQDPPTVEILRWDQD